MNLYSRFEHAFSRSLDKPALVQADAPDWTYARLKGQVELAAGALAAAGVAPGDRVLAQLPKLPETVALYLACLKIGAVYVPVNTAYTPREVAYFIEDSEPRLFVATDPEAGNGGVQVETLTESDGTWRTRLAGAEPVQDTIVRDDGDLAAILYTSGTTGRAKGAMLSHNNLASNVLALDRYWGWQDDDVLLHALPIFHVHGLFVALHCAFLRATPVIFQRRFDIDALIAELPNATVLMGVPTFYTRLLADPRFDAALAAGVRLFISGSAPLTEQTFAEFEARTGKRILERYGMTETLMNTSNPLDGERVAGSVGFALPRIEARIASEDGQVLGPGEVGGIEVRGQNVFSGYWRMPERTAEEFRADGFFRTGDLGVMDAEGRFSIVGRAKDLVISGGYNVYPKEVERLLDEMPEVTESAVIGVPHPDFGEAVVAVLVAADGVSEDRVDAHLRGNLARYKQPKRVLCVEELPRNAMGKVQKNELRERYSDIFTA
ncbi:MAG: AMP-binding protein [Gammaproteobacteria bacterium]|nr:AMP-binding protein [Gammaproteobacteria bacterium]